MSDQDPRWRPLSISPPQQQFAALWSQATKIDTPSASSASSAPSTPANQLMSTNMLALSSHEDTDREGQSRRWFGDSKQLSTKQLRVKRPRRPSHNAVGSTCYTGGCMSQCCMQLLPCHHIVWCMPCARQSAILKDPVCPRCAQSIYSIFLVTPAQHPRHDWENGLPHLALTSPPTHPNSHPNQSPLERVVIDQQMSPGGEVWVDMEMDEPEDERAADRYSPASSFGSRDNPPVSNSMLPQHRLNQRGCSRGSCGDPRSPLRAFSFLL